MATIQQKETIRRREGDPAGTYFAVTVMLVLLALVGMYLISAFADDVRNSPVIQGDAGAKSALPTAGYY